MPPASSAHTTTINIDCSTYVAFINCEATRTLRELRASYIVWQQIAV